MGKILPQYSEAVYPRDEFLVLMRTTSASKRPKKFKIKRWEGGGAKAQVVHEKKNGWQGVFRASRGGGIWPLELTYGP
jgi:hypothetical protein